MARSSSTATAIASGIAQVFGVTCTTPECGYHESLHTTDQVEAVRTARELGWRISGDGWQCPLCVGAVESSNGHARRARKAVRA